MASKEILNMDVYRRLDAADKKAYKESSPRYQALKKAISKSRNQRLQQRLPKQERPKKYQPTEKDKRWMTGYGYHGLGAVEMNRRIAQNEAIADVAFGKVSSKQKTLTAEDQAHVYRGLKFQGRADLFRKAKNYGKP
tara:strand:- start:2487 stop:2897 length:411 start_codon:yes stop_codon:yes gene_type:complete